MRPAVASKRSGGLIDSYAPPLRRGSPSLSTHTPTPSKRSGVLIDSYTASFRRDRLSLPRGPVSLSIHTLDPFEEIGVPFEEVWCTYRFIHCIPSKGLAVPAQRLSAASIHRLQPFDGAGRALEETRGLSTTPRISVRPRRSDRSAVERERIALTIVRQAGVLGHMAS